jgi:large conductance mechanosensitive channel
MKRFEKLMKEFKTFAVKGNMVDLAIGLTVGAGFKEIVSSLVNDIVMPPIGLVLGKVNFTDLYLNLSAKKYPTLAAAESAGAPIIKYGNFLNTIIDFAIVAFVIFFVVKIINQIKNKEEKKEISHTKKCPFCVTKIHENATRCPNCTSKLS